MKRTGAPVGEENAGYYNSDSVTTADSIKHVRAANTTMRRQPAD
jgi:hypothetical protein